MKRRDKRGGFTLLEIIIVIIIIGVLASLALPRFFTTVEFSKSMEALMSMGTLRGSMERCYMASSGSYTTCTLANLDMENPGNSPGARFTYAVSGQSATGYVITATRNTLDGGTAGDTITLTQTATGVTRGGTGKFVGIK
ncbi:MAG: prepilin-type N-terminal cleavage/methylation domain-containing protein [Candidatus Omnitrophica bacterium]|nr:prepilin-type N-terminal cleavage/methylation domain-containing protein [Candidatus Omnitrophota bacterium]